MVRKIEVFPITGLPLSKPGDDVGELIYRAIVQSNFRLSHGDVVVVAHSFVSKAEGNIVNLNEVEPSQFAKMLAEQTGKDSRHVEVVLRNSKKLVRIGHGVIICETPHGFVCANAGVDASNSGGEEYVITLPEDPDRSAKNIQKTLRLLTGVDVAVIITDSFGRPFRKGSVNVAVGCSGINPLNDIRGQKDLYGRVLRSKIVCLADQIAAAAGLAMGEADEATPVAVVRGLVYDRTNIPAKAIVREEYEDLFR